MNITKLLTTVLDSSHNFRKISQRFIKVKNAYLPATLIVYSDLVLCLDSRLIDEYWVKTEDFSTKMSIGIEIALMEILKWPFYRQFVERIRFN